MIIKSIYINTETKNKIIERLKSEYPPSYFLIRDKMKRELGFLFRDHSYYDVMAFKYVNRTAIDFFDEQKKTMFLLKYGYFISN
jgi:hypothetical protein